MLKYFVLSVQSVIGCLLLMMVLQAFESPWPLVQANAAYFAACLLSEISDSKPLALYLSQVTIFS